jgi:hypothetical protein
MKPNSQEEGSEKAVVRQEESSDKKKVFQVPDQDQEEGVPVARP